jgi:RNA polymerase sigma factor (sigma-70 family)
MDELSQAEQYLLTHVRAGDADAWRQLVTRYQGRLCAFARARRGGAEAEDLVQETFLQFLTGLHAFRGRSSIETYLFTILRRRLADHARASMAAPRRRDPNAGPADPLEKLPAADPTASAYVARQEQDDARREALSAALSEVVGKLKAEENLNHLKVIELVLSVQMRNKDVAAAMGMTEPQVALVKHRCVNQLHDAVLRRLGLPAADVEPPAESLLTDVWQELRPTCPKRSTLGRHCLGTLDEPWRGYVDFHLNRVSCAFCRANVDDLSAEVAAAPIALSRPLFQSTIGFFKPPPSQSR